MNNFFSEGGRDLRVGSTPTNAGTPVRLVPSMSLYDLAKCRLGLGLQLGLGLGLGLGLELQLGLGLGFQLGLGLGLGFQLGLGLEIFLNNFCSEWW